jgi:hypothetical protein
MPPGGSVVRPGADLTQAVEFVTEEAHSVMVLIPMRYGHPAGTERTEGNTMSDEVDLIVEGTIVDDSPIASPAQARELMAEALSLLKQGEEIKYEGRLLLEVAERRLAWKVLGFDSWQDCLARGLEETFKISIDQSKRMAIVASLRLESLSSQDIADQLGVHATTVNRDLRKGREVGLLDDEPDKLMGRDGRTRATGKPESSAPERPPKAKPRADLLKHWMNRVEELRRPLNALRLVRESDDRYARRLSELADTTLVDLRAAHLLLGDILTDFTAAEPREN